MLVGGTLEAHYVLHIFDIQRDIEIFDIQRAIEIFDIQRDIE